MPPVEIIKPPNAATTLPPPSHPSRLKKVSMLHLGVHKLIPLHLEHRWESWERKRCRLSRKYRRCTKFRLTVWLVPSHIVAGWHTTKTANEGGSDLLHRSFGGLKCILIWQLGVSPGAFMPKAMSQKIWIFIFSHSGRNVYVHLSGAILSDTTAGKQKLEVEQSLRNWITILISYLPACQLVADNAFWMFHSAIYQWLMLQFSASLLTATYIV